MLDTVLTQPTAYIYNGHRLPKLNLPKEYTYVFIYKGKYKYGGSSLLSYSLFCSTSPMTIEIDSNGDYLLVKNVPHCSYAYNAQNDKEWRLVSTYTSQVKTYIKYIDIPVWSSHKISYPNGTTYIAKSKSPVALYEGDTVPDNSIIDLYSWTVGLTFGLIDGLGLIDNSMYEEDDRKEFALISISMIDGTNEGIGGNIYNATYSGGVFNNGKYILNGKGYLTIPTPFMSSTKPWTIAFTIDNYTPYSNTYARFARGNNDVPSIFYTKSLGMVQTKLAKSSANTTYVTIVDNSIVTLSNTAIGLNVMQFQPTTFVFRNDGKYITLWINGVKTLQEESSRYTSSYFASQFSIGDDANSDYYMSHLECSMLKAWDYALTDDKIIDVSSTTDIMLVNQAESSTNEATSCKLTIDNCTIGNTLILAYAVRGDGNDPSLPDGWIKLGGGNNVSDADNYGQRLYFAYKIVVTETEIITLTQTTTGRIYMVCSEYKNVGSVIMRNDLASIGTSNYTVQGTKTNDTDVMIYGITSAYYSSSGGRLQEVSPIDLNKIQGDATQERLACWFDFGNGALKHEFKTFIYTEARDAILECVQLFPIIST